MTLFIEMFGKFNERLSHWAAALAIFATVLIVVVSVIDVIGSKVFGIPLFGSIDIIQIAQWLAMTCAASITLYKKMHIRVDFVVDMLPKRLQAIVDGIVYVLCFCFFVVIVWNLFKHGYSFQAGGEQSSTARIPLHPFVYLGALGCMLVALAYLQQFMNLVWPKRGAGQPQPGKG